MAVSVAAVVVPAISLVLSSIFSFDAPFIIVAVDAAAAVRTRIESERNTLTRGRGRSRGAAAAAPAPAAEPPKPKRVIPNPPTTALLAEYKKALDTAVKLATVNNVSPLRGDVLIFCDVSGSMTYNVSKTIGKVHGVRNAADMAILMGLMIAYASERSELYLFSSPSKSSTAGYILFSPNKDSLLETFDAAKHEASKLGLETEFPFVVLKEKASNKRRVDYVIIISDMIIAPRKAHPAGAAILDHVNKLRSAGNPNLCFVCVDLFGSGSAFVGGSGTSPNDIYITGYSDAILRYINARREIDAQVADVERMSEELKAKLKEREGGKGKEKEGKEEEL